MLNFLEAVKLDGAEVHIVGPGPNGAPHHDRIGGDVTFALNKAVLLEKPWDYWVCAAPLLPQQEWFRERMDVLVHLSRGCYDAMTPKLVFQQGILSGMYNPHYTFDRSIYNGSVAGKAITLAVLAGASRIVLCGIDMHGTGYWDGDSNIAKKSIMPDGTWTALPKLQKLVYEVDVPVVSLSETKLKVEVV